MKSYDAFPDDFDYHMYLYRQENRGRLPDTTADEAMRAEMLNQVLDPNPPDGFYVEIGPAVSPYALTTSRRNINYVAIDGGKSEYPAGGNTRGWGEYDWHFTKYIDDVVATLPQDAVTKSAQFIWGDAQALTFLDADRTKLREDKRSRSLPIRETFMRDVLLTPGVHPRSVEKIFAEQARVLATNGLLIIRETNYRHYHHLFGEGRSPSFLSLLANLELTGFKHRLTVFCDDPIFPQLIRQYPGGEDVPGSFNAGYYIISQQGPDKEGFWKRIGRRLGSSAIK